MLAVHILKLSDVDALIDEVADIAYDKAVETLTDEVILQTHKEDIELVEETKRWIMSHEDYDEITSNPLLRYVPCRIEKIDGSEATV